MGIRAVEIFRREAKVTEREDRPKDMCRDIVRLRLQTIPKRRVDALVERKG